jgi:hypothetical protein
MASKLDTLEKARDICAFWNGGKHLDPRSRYRVREVHRGLRSRAVRKTRDETGRKGVTRSECIGGSQGALVTPQLLRLLQNKIDPKHRARSQLQALL